MSSQGPNFPGTGADATGIGTVTWSNPGNITADDSSYATAAPGPFAVTHYLKATNFGFSIPAGATINGILVEWKYKGNPGPILDTTQLIVKAGTPGGTNHDLNTDWSSTEAYVSYGGSSDLWGLAWAPADINASTFGAALSCTEDGGAPQGVPNVNTVRITVFYTPVQTKPISVVIQPWQDDTIGFLMEDL